MEIYDKSIPTEETIIKNQFENNLSITEKKNFIFKYLWIFIFNRYRKMKINWFIN